ncbi:MAG TPA: pentapeptide repeat-containing protein, partial [Chroococcales cyanobacterium]
MAFSVLVLQGFTTVAQAAEPKQLEQLLATKACPNCDLTDAQLTGAILQQADLRGAKLDGAKLDGANLTGANLSNAQLR